MTCDLCGRDPVDEDETLGWGSWVERGEVRRLCPECARESVRGIEGKLDPAYW